MPAQVSVLSRKVFLDASDYVWYSSAMYFGGYVKADLFLEAHGLATGCQADIVLEGATEPGENANWQVMTDTGSALTVKGVSKFSTTDIYPYVRVKVIINDAGGATIRAAELSLNGQLFEEV